MLMKRKICAKSVKIMLEGENACSGVAPEMDALVAITREDVRGACLVTKSAKPLPPAITDFTNRSKDS
jgi:hypothetical protein